MRDSEAEQAVDLSNCDREEIHLVERVQGYGALVTVDAGGRVRRHSANLAEMLGLEAVPAPGTALADALGAAQAAALTDRAALIGPDLEQVRASGLGFPAGAFDAAIHRVGPETVIELEPAGPTAEADDVTLVQTLMNAVRRQPTIQAAAEEATRTVRRLTGHDRVMCYRFGEDGSGTVVAEDAAPEVESYLHLRFPATDIPAQARALYRRNALRQIADVDGPTHRLVPEPARPDGRLDMSLCTTRAVSPVHLEYLRNMGVVASMSVSILRDGALWGLFACHSHKPHALSLGRRAAVELFAQLFAYEISVKSMQVERAHDGDARRLHDALVARVSRGGDIASAIDVVADEIRPVIGFDGIAVVSDDAVATIGVAPDEEACRAIAAHVAGAASPGKVFHTATLQDAMPEAAHLSEPVAGVMALPISLDPGNYILLLRGEVARTVVWAGNPNKPVRPTSDGLRLSPRNSFAAWHQTVTGQSVPWSESERAAAEALRATLLEVVLRMADEAARERVRFQEKQGMLIGELNHRMRNILNLIRSLAQQTRGAAASLEEYAREFDGRLVALSRAHDQLIAGREGEGASLVQLLALEMQAYGGEAGRLVIEGRDVMLPGETFSTLALVMHEMVTNSMKHGALSRPEGRIAVTLRHGPEALRVEWREQGGPPVAEPTRRGFGSTIVERAIPHELGGSVQVRYAAGGLEADFVLPNGHLALDEPLPGDAAEAEAPAEAKAPEPDDAPTRVAAPLAPAGPVLLVEDNMIIALDAADMLAGLGCGDVRSAASVSEALAHVDAEMPVAALLDVNLGRGETSLPVAERLRDAGVPYAFTTGYADDGQVLREHPGAPVLGKPFTEAELAAVLARLLD
ncbi:HWE histidine kinase domain-containing protein [Jannaschia sp. W003]|uniref:HWE histidine kinase domain-containing protein n=1 Tax=Jannaschia sp. W003 TaxID=2867012 RepID=UPI0021A42466|nr:HWE histidine kinase domain-containing protein [Jannaschia sp. W003]UWQ21301.1 GAF domain-containing protein [Jannaschia sp. W003]